MRTFKRAVLFILLNLLVFGLLNTIQVEVPYLDRMLLEFRTGDYNGVVLGQSNSEIGINPQLLSDEKDHIYNFGRRMTESPDFYYLLQELNRDGKVKTVYMEIDPTYWSDNYFSTIPRGWDVNMYYHLSFPLKLQYLFEVTAHRPVLTIGDYPVEPHLLLQCLKDYPKNMRERMGRLSVPEKQTEPAAETIPAAMPAPTMEPAQETASEEAIQENRQEPAYTPDLFRKEDMCPIQEKYLKKMIRYCEKRNIRLICYSTCLPPVRLQSENHGDKNAYFRELLQTYGMNYYDLSFARKEYLDYENEDFLDAVGHAGQELANRQTEFLKMAAGSGNPEAYFYEAYEDVLKKFQ